jgi:hypothetical protein
LVAPDVVLWVAVDRTSLPLIVWSVSARYRTLPESRQHPAAATSLDETITFERTPYPSAGCFFLNDEQLSILTGSPHFLDGDVSYLSPLDPAVTLSVMKTFRVYKPVLDQACFLEVLHGSPRWIGPVSQIATIATQPPPGTNTESNEVLASGCPL